MAEFEPKLIDTHGHVNFNAFRDDGDEVIKRALDQGVGIIMPGSQIDTSRRAVEYAEKLNHPYIKAAVGLHPIHLEDIEVDDSEVEGQAKFHTRREEFRRAAYEDLIKSGGDKVVAIGEVGLDYWRLPSDPKELKLYKDRQMDTLNTQLDLAFEYKLPAILHCRKAHDDIISIIESHGTGQAANPPGVMHCYTGNKTQLKSFLALGWYIGYNGIIFKLDLVDVIKDTPLDRILLETDSPYLTPPIAGSGRNEPIFVKHVAEKIAEIKQVSFEEVARQTTENAEKVFRLGN
ncbi:MAG: TatD family hydrolase [Candidatus Spechtbacterales bacterium]